MFVFSFKSSKAKLIGIGVIILIALAAIIFFASGKTRPATNDGDISLRASDAAERVSFLSQFGWKFDEDPVEICEVIIPTEFDKTYEEYNAIQKNQNFDLEKYKGERVKRYTYEIKNHPDYPADSGFIRANILVFDGLVIGGDVSSLEPNGFQQGFDYPTSVTSQTESTVENETTNKIVA